jgi:hypothetical protein
MINENNILIINIKIFDGNISALFKICRQKKKAALCSLFLK